MPQTQHTDQQHRAILQSIAERAMLDRGMLPDFSVAVLAELDTIQARAGVNGESAGNSAGIRDLTNLLWASIDNDDSRDLDQLTIAEALPADKVMIRVAVADVDALVKKGSAIDEHARHNTTSVYTAAKIFPMLPERLSTDLTSLNFDEERLAVVVEMVIGADGSVQGSDIYRARVRNHAKLAYNSVAAWLEGNGALPEGVAAVNGLAENLRVQDRIAQRLKNLRHVHGALSLETIEAKPIFDGDQIRDLEPEEKNRAKEIIEDFMIAANGVTARYLAAKKLPSIRRVVRTPKRWDRIVELAQEHQIQAARYPRLGGTRRVSCQSESSRSVALPRSLPRGSQTPGIRRISRRTAGRRGTRALWAGGQGLCPFHRPESPLHRSDHAAPVEGRYCRQRHAVQLHRTGGAGQTFHRSRGCRQQGRTAGWQICGSDPA